MSQGTILSCRGKSPKIDPSCWIAPNATIAGEVTLGSESSCWFQSVIRGDVASISIGSRVNIQDGAIIHGTFEKSCTVIEDDVSIGHGAIVHGAHIKKGALVGMGAIVMDGAVIGEHAVIAAGAVVRANTIVAPATLWTGVPAKLHGPVKDELRTELEATALRYIEYANWFRNQT